MQQTTPTVQAEVAQLYGGLFVPVFLALAVTYALGIVAAVLLPAGQLSDELEPAAEPTEPTTDPASEPLTA